MNSTHDSTGRRTRAAAVFLGLLLTAAAAFAGETPRPAAALKVKTLDGGAVTVDGLRGKVVAVMFFSTDCSHCQRTATILAQIYQEWKSRGLEIIGVAINPTAAGNLGAFAKKYGAKFPLALGTRADLTRFAEISVMARFYVPYMMFVDRKGTVRFEHPGGDRKFWLNQEANLRSELDALLKEPAPKKASS